MTKNFLFLTMLFLFACASEEKKSEPKTYSDETNKAFEMIERGGSYYLKKAPTPSAPPQIESPKKTVKKTPPPEDIFIDEKINYQEAPAPAPKKTSGNSKVDEKLVEINQNLAFYCMKQRNNPAFGGDEARCMKHVSKVQKDCQKKHRLVNNKLLNCIKTGLKR